MLPDNGQITLFPFYFHPNNRFPRESRVTANLATRAPLLKPTNSYHRHHLEISTLLSLIWPYPPWRLLNDHDVISTPYRQPEWGQSTYTIPTYGSHVFFWCIVLWSRQLVKSWKVSGVVLRWQYRHAKTHLRLPVIRSGLRGLNRTPCFKVLFYYSQTAIKMFLVNDKIFSCTFFLLEFGEAIYY